MRLTERSKHFSSLLWICGAHVKESQPRACVTSCLTLPLISTPPLVLPTYTNVFCFVGKFNGFSLGDCSKRELSRNEAFQSRWTIVRLLELQLTPQDINRFIMCVSTLLSRTAVPVTLITYTCTSAHQPYTLASDTQKSIFCFGVSACECINI